LRAYEIAIRGLLKYVQEDEICLPFREERIERRISMQYTEATERGRHGRYPIWTPTSFRRVSLAYPPLLDAWNGALVVAVCLAGA
jgi:hypothetical protein